ncbi:MAG: amidohydrolase family protein [Eubacteriaceae bacterium]|nr:amidohydrolase family protein [Eubacteriaceae bacterium]
MINQDNHIHLILDGKNYKEAVKRHENGPDENYIRSVFEGYKQRGVKYLRDGGDNMGVGIYAKHIAHEYGISYLSPDFALHKKGYYGDILGKSFEDEKDLEKRLDELEKSGADFVKIMASGIMNFSDYGAFDGGMIGEDEIRRYIGRIKARSFPVMVHVNSDASVRAAVLSGADSIEHGFFMEKETIHLLAEHECVWVPTICAVGNLVNNKNMRGADRNVLENTVKKQIENVTYAINIGCRVALGTDAGSYGVSHENAISCEEDLLMECSWDYEKMIDISNKFLWKKFGGK